MSCGHYDPQPAAMPALFVYFQVVNIQILRHEKTPADYCLQTFRGRDIGARTQDLSDVNAAL